MNSRHSREISLYMQKQAEDAVFRLSSHPNAGLYATYA